MEEPESIEIRTPDGHSLGAELREPHRRQVLGTCIFMHPMYANKSVFAPARGGVAGLFVAAGWRTLAFDFRGHGDSKPNRAREHPWGYDDLVQVDLPTVVEAARVRWPRAPLALVGHSLGGQIALAAQGAGVIAADAIVSVASNVWMRRFEPSRLIWAAKMAGLASFGALTRKHGYFPARALRIGSDDEAGPFVEDFCRFALEDAWRSRDGSVDYAASLAHVRAPILTVTSAGDRLVCRTVSVCTMMNAVPSWTHHVIESGRDGRPPPGHMHILTRPETHDGWTRILAWLADLRGTMKAAAS